MLKSNNKLIQIFYSETIKSLNKKTPSIRPIINKIFDTNNISL